MIDELENLITINTKPTTEEIFTHLKYIHTILKKNNISHWLMYGTLLGSIRNRDIIPYDYDFDFGIFYEDVDKILSIKQEDPSYEITKTTGTLYSTHSKFKKSYTKWRISLKVNYKENPVGDLYIYYLYKDGYYRRYDPNEKILFWPKSIFPKIFLDKFEYSFIRDLKLPVPYKSICLLKYFYGPMWVTPIKASSQNGENHPDYDYYAGYLYSNLKKLCDNVKEESKKDGIIIEEMNEPELECKDVEYIFPLDQFEWMKDNNKNMDFKKYFKVLKKEKKNNNYNNKNDNINNNNNNK
jgi:hypothetical protein